MTSPSSPTRWTALQERAKLLQEELAARVTEDAGSKLNVLTALTAVFLPMTLITGIFGMNVAGLPGTAESATADAFWWTMLLIVAVGAVTLACFLGRSCFDVQATYAAIPSYGLG